MNRSLSSFLRRLRRLCAAAASLALLCGCSTGSGIYRNFRAIEELQTVHTLGIDRSAAGVSVIAAVDDSDSDNAPPVVRRSGSSILRAMDQLQDYTRQGRLFFAHVRYVLLGQEQAEAGLGELLDYVERDVDTRMGTALFVLRDSTAESLLSTLSGGEIFQLLASIQRDTSLQGGSHVYDVRSTAVSLSEYGAAPVCALRLVPTEDSVLSDTPEYTAIPDGYGILKGGSLVAFLSGRDAEAASLLAGQLGTVNRTYSVGTDGRVTLELQCAGPNFSYHAGAEGKPAVLEVSARVTAALAEAHAPEGQVLSEEMMRQLSAEVSAELTENIRQALTLAKTLDADYLSLAAVLQRPGKAILSEDWLQSVEFQIRVDTVIDHSYDMSEPLGAEGGHR